MLMAKVVGGLAGAALSSRARRRAREAVLGELLAAPAVARLSNEVPPRRGGGMPAAPPLLMPFYRQRRVARLRTRSPPAGSQSCNASSSCPMCSLWLRSLRLLWLALAAVAVAPVAGKLGTYGRWRRPRVSR